MARTRTTRVKTGVIAVDGLTELNRELRNLGPEFKGELRRTNKSVADFVAEDASAAAFSLGGTAAKVAPSIKSTAGALSAGVAFGGAAHPEAGGAEFGANRNRIRQRSSGSYVGYRQFKDWRGSGPTAGYFVYPTIRRNADRIETEYGEAVDHLLKKANLA
jgi:predicted phage gp36 major capsid-like protein